MPHQGPDFSFRLRPHFFTAALFGLAQQSVENWHLQSSGEFVSHMKRDCVGKAVLRIILQLSHFESFNKSLFFLFEFVRSRAKYGSKCGRKKTKNGRGARGNTVSGWFQSLSVFSFPVVNLTFVGFVRLLSISWLVVKKKLNYQLLILCVNA